MRISTQNWLIALAFVAAATPQASAQGGRGGGAAAPEISKPTVLAPNPRIDALKREPTNEYADLAPEARKVMSAFVVDGRLTGMPTSHAKRLVLLDWLAQDFEPGRRYTEQMVNLIIGKRHPDTAAWRRYLVDEELLAREAGEYWRIGGTVG